MAINPQSAGVAGTIHVSDRAIAAIVARAVEETDDVVGLVTPDAPSHAAVLSARSAERGMSIRQHGEAVVVDVFVVLVHGSAITQVSEALEAAICQRLEFALGRRPAVHVRLKGLRRLGAPLSA